MNAGTLELSGRIARRFLDNPLTPILALAGLLLGIAAAVITPREEEPQIDVTMADVFVPFPGATAEDVEQLVTWPLEQVLSEIDGIEHVYSVSRPGQAVITVEFEVGVPRHDAIVRLYNQVYSNADWAPERLGVGPALVRPMGIDDVPVMTVTLWTDDSGRGATELAAVAHTLETELKRIPGTRDVYTVGAPERAVMVELDAARLAAYGMTIDDLTHALANANVVTQAGERTDPAGIVPLTVGRFLADAEQVAALVIGLDEGRPLYLSDVADIQHGADLPQRYTWFGAPPGRDGPVEGIAPAVTLAIAKKPGHNAADITRAVRKRVDALHGTLIPDRVQATVTRDYGLTASDKATKLIQKLGFATATVVLLVLAALGWREAIVVGIAVLVTLALTLFASWAMGFTINRVSLFALIFSIGILVDDAIVVVENIHRHMRLGGRTLRDAIPAAVSEVGGPTILATFTVIAALLPMAFVSGLMGPYMRPIPINASAGMLISLAVALIVTPWLSLKLLTRHRQANAGERAHDAIPARLHRFFEGLLRPFLDAAHGKRRRRLLFAGMASLILLASGLVLMQWVVLKMLPFDNKSELQLVVDLPEGRTLEDGNRLLLDLAAALDDVPEVLDYQGYAGGSAPINFNGLVRQYYLRQGANVADLQVNLVDHHDRSRSSHDIARALRPALTTIAQRHDASLKIVEVPPGPPVLAPIVAELYGPDYAQLRRLGRETESRFRDIDGIVDIDSSVETTGRREIAVVDRERAARLGIDQADIARTLHAAISGDDATYLHDGASKYPVPVRLRLPPGDQASLDALLALRMRAGDDSLVPLSELVRIVEVPWEASIHHKDLLPVVYVTGDEAGSADSPLYGMFALRGAIARDGTIDQHLIGQPVSTDRFALKWDGEWHITYETFRDMGLAYSVGLMLIYLLVVGQFRSYVLPLIIMAPIPLTMIGVMPGHALLGAQFTATSMIGMIALAGIIVRNSILLVDFIRQTVASGQPLDEAVVEACAVRAQPIALTALAAMAGALFIVDDPIFNGLAISLIFGVLVSTALTLIVIPLLYYGWMSRRRHD